MKIKNKILLLFSIFFIVGINCYLFNVPLVRGGGDEHWYILPGGTVPCGGPIQNCGIPPGSWIGPSFQPVKLPPQLSFSGTNPVMTSSGVSVTLNWSASSTPDGSQSNPKSCIASSTPVNNQWKGEKELSGSQTITNITNPITFGLRCYSESGGYSTNTIRIRAVAQPNTGQQEQGDSSKTPSTLFYADSSQVFSGESVILNWESTNVSSCAALANPVNSQWTGSRASSGSQVITNITEDTAFQLVCAGNGYNIPNTITVTLNTTSSPTNSDVVTNALIFYINPTQVPPGGPATLTWSSANLTSCTASASPNNNQWSGIKDLSGSQAINNITADTTFSLACTGTEGNNTKTASIVLGNALPSAPVAPNTTQPSDKATVGTNVNFSWTNTIATDGWYNFYYKKQTDSSWIKILNLTNRTYFLSNLPTNTAYNWKIQACDSETLCSDSATWSFTTVANSTISSSQLTGSNSNFCYTFTTTLKYKDTGYAVGALQAILRKEGLLNITKLTTYFGEATRQAVISFQEKYKDDILTPIGLTKGTGNVGIATIKKLNELYECK